MLKAYQARAQGRNGVRETKPHTTGPKSLTLNPNHSTLSTPYISNASTCRNLKRWYVQNSHTLIYAEISSSGMCRYLKLGYVQKSQILVCSGEGAGAEWRIAGDAGVPHVPLGPL
jgi:hypothetical protein